MPGVTIFVRPALLSAASPKRRSFRAQTIMMAHQVTLLTRMQFAFVTRIRRRRLIGPNRLIRLMPMKSAVGVETRAGCSCEG
jgi:hypothetical protein